MQVGLTVATILCALLVVIAHRADRRRLTRTSADRVGFMPWPTVAMLATVAAITLAALALLTRG